MASTKAQIFLVFMYGLSSMIALCWLIFAELYLLSESAFRIRAVLRESFLFGLFLFVMLHFLAFLLFRWFILRVRQQKETEKIILISAIVGAGISLYTFYFERGQYGLYPNPIFYSLCVTGIMWNFLLPIWDGIRGK